jgi:hypothetical protein
MVPVPLPDALRAGRPVTRSGLPDGDGAAHRVVARQAVFGGQPVTVVVAVSPAQEQRSLMSIGKGLAVGLPVLMALVAVTTRVLTGYTLRPVETLVLAADPGAWKQRGPVLLDGLRWLHGLMDDLLALAGLDDPGHRSARRTVDLDDVVFAEMSEVRATTDRTIDASGVSAAQVLADPRAMARVVRNLLDNAVRHARSEVAVTLHEHDRVAVLTVADDGTGVPTDQRERILDWFVRRVRTRSRDRARPRRRARRPSVDLGRAVRGRCRAVPRCMGARAASCGAALIRTAALLVVEDDDTIGRERTGLRDVARGTHRVRASP